MSYERVAEVCLWVMAGVGAIVFVLAAAGLINEWRLWRAGARMWAEVRAWLAQRRGE